MPCKIYLNFEVRLSIYRFHSTRPNSVSREYFLSTGCLLLHQTLYFQTYFNPIQSEKLRHEKLHTNSKQIQFPGILTEINSASKSATQTICLGKASQKPAILSFPATRAIHSHWDVSFHNTSAIFKLQTHSRNEI